MNWAQHSTPSFAATPEKKSGGKWPCLFLLAFLVLGVVFIGGLLGVLGKAAGSISTSTSSSDFIAHIEEKTIVKGGSQRIAHIDLEGIIMNNSGRSGTSMVEDFQQLMQKAVNDDKVVAIVVRINSPGGEVTASDLLHRTVQQADAKKPVIAYMDSIAASGGYYTACGARKILAHPTTLTGSIGVIMQSVQYHQLMEKIGMGMQVYKSGKFKDMLSGSRPTSDEESAYVNAMIRQTYERFLEVVSASRKKPVGELRDSAVADGRVYSGKDALASGMVDGNGYIDDAYAEAMQAAGVHNATVVRYRPSLGLFDSLRFFGEATAAKGKIELDVSDRLMPRLQPGVAYFLHLPAAAQP